MIGKRRSYAEVTMKSGAVVTFECSMVTWERSRIGVALKWETPGPAKHRAVMVDPDEVAAVVFVDGTK